MKTRNIKFAVLILHLVVASLILSGCAQGVPVTQTAIPSPAPYTNYGISPTATTQSVPMPDITLKPGDYYFSVDGQPGFIFSRNVAGYKQVQYDTFLDWSQTGGTTFVRIQLDSHRDGLYDHGWCG